MKRKHSARGKKPASWITQLSSAVSVAAQDPLEAIRLLEGLRVTPEVAGDREAEHSVLQVLIGLLINQRAKPPHAVELARRLVELCPDRMHLKNLAQALRLLGDGAAEAIEISAESAPNIHMTPEAMREYEWALAIAEGRK